MYFLFDAILGVSAHLLCVMAGPRQVVTIIISKQTHTEYLTTKESCPKKSPWILLSKQDDKSPSHVLRSDFQNPRFRRLYYFSNLVSFQYSIHSIDFGNKNYIQYCSINQIIFKVEENKHTGKKRNGGYWMYYH